MVMSPKREPIDSVRKRGVLSSMIQSVEVCPVTVMIPPASFMKKSTATTSDVIVVIVSGKLHATAVNKTKKDLDMKQPIIIAIIHWDQHKNKLSLIGM